uniref:Uncharacterized protein n=1 Tax=Serinus canaria TaxID=9135 RepID=A0A8C9NN36_SERCA
KYFCYPTLHLQQHPEVGIPSWDCSWSFCVGTQSSTMHKVMLNWPQCS